MINQGSWQDATWDDGWTAVMRLLNLGYSGW